MIRMYTLIAFNIDIDDTMDKRGLFTQTMLEWWEYHRRDLPWRKTNDPYIVLVTEMLLRKTTAGQVKHLYNKFFEKYHNVEKLADANPNELRDIIKPLGLVNQRSDQLISMAKKVKMDFRSKIPVKCEDLLSLPGVGRYTSSGVRCIAYKHDEAMVDTNVIKIIGRYFGYKPKKLPAYNDMELWHFVRTLIPPGKCKEFNLGLIDFVSAVCTSKKPKCAECILNKNCNLLIGKQ